MLATTDAIVLSLQPHSDKAHVLHAYTRAGGRVNYMVYGLGRKNAAGKYNPLAVIQLSADFPAAQSGLGGKFPTVRTAQLTFIPQTTITDPHKRTIALFISEVLFHVLRHPMTDEPMFDFLVQTIEELDRTIEPQNFHLAFLVNFAAKLGFKMEKEPEFPTSRKARQTVLKALCEYMAEHVETWQDPKSLDVLMEVFD